MIASIENLSVTTDVLSSFEKGLKETLIRYTKEGSILFEAANYSLFSQGKRLRPRLLFATLEALGTSPEIGIDASIALEMIHTYSLIHDDLPCMDDDDFRRGLPTLHKKFDEATATLTGDLLLTLAFEVLACSSSYSEKERLKLIQVLSFRGGGKGMILGQMQDLEFLKRAPSLYDLEAMYQRKTADLLIASLQMGGIIGGANEETKNALMHFGQEVGLAFQIIDDVIDVKAPEVKHGTLTSSDERMGKTTYVSLLGVDGAEKKAHSLLQCALERISILQNPIPLQSLAKALVERSY